MPESPPHVRAETLVVGPFLLSFAQKALLFRSKRLRLGSQAFDILAALLACPGTVVPAAKLLRSADPGAPLTGITTAQTAKLLKQVALINQVVGECVASGYYVAHYPEEGFVFLAPASVVTAQTPQTPPTPRVQLSIIKEQDGRYPSGRPVSVIGRAPTIARLARQLALQRFITIVGAGGMGKTTMAMALVAQLSPSYRDGVFILDLAPLADARLVATALASALGLALAGQDTLGGLAAFVRDKNILVLLDSCEHVLASAAIVAEAVLDAAEGVHILATSREPLLARGEYLHRLLPMGLPASGKLPTTALEAMSYSAVQLFVERARAGNASYKLNDVEAGPVTALCMQLDGIPLAIEIAAARIAQLGVMRLSSQVQSRLLSLSGSRRTAPARHKTLAAMLDWSHDLLLDREKWALRRLSVFRGIFTLDAAAVLVADEDINMTDAADAVLNLVEKSLVNVVQGGFRLLDTTRAYASDKLGTNGEYIRVRHRHARYLCELLGGAEADWQAIPRPEWLSIYGSWIDDIRIALDWLFTEEGDELLGIALTYASFALARQLSLDADFKEYVQRALTALMSVSPRQYLVEVTLKAYIASMGQRIYSQESPHYRSMEQIMDMGDSGITVRDQIIALGSINHVSLMAANFSDAMDSANKASRAAYQSADPVAIMISQRMQAQSHHFMGRHASGQTLAQDVLDNCWRKIPLTYIPSPVEQRVSMRILMARILWMQGYSEQADRMAEETLRQSQSDTAIAQCQTLAMCALPIALWSGRNDTCHAFASELHALATRHSLRYWQHWAKCYGQLLALYGGGAEAAVDPELLQQGAFEANMRDHLCTFNGRLFGVDNLARVNGKLVGWCTPEVLRLQAEAIWNEAPHDSSGTEELLHQSIGVAREQGALAWQLRSTTSLAQLLRANGRDSEARDQLAGVYGQFTEGFDTADMLRARLLLADLNADRGARKARLRVCK